MFKSSLHKKDPYWTAEMKIWKNNFQSRPSTYYCTDLDPTTMVLHTYIVCHINSATILPLGLKIHNDIALSAPNSPHQNSGPLSRIHAHGLLAGQLMEHTT